MTTTAPRNARKTRDAALARRVVAAIRVLALGPSRPIRPQPGACRHPSPRVLGRTGAGAAARRTAKFQSLLGGEDGSSDPRTNRSSSPATTGDAARQAWDKHTWLYIAVIIAVVLGATIGLIWPEFGVALKPIGKGFVALIKMMIAPIIFCTIVVGVGSIAKAATVGKIGGLALLYFMIMTTFALAIGLVVGNLIHPGEGLNMTDSTYDVDATEAKTTAGVHPRHHPDDVLLGVHRRERASGAVHRPARRLRAAADGPEGRADHERRQEPAGAGVPHPRHDPLARPARRVRRHRRGRRQDRGSRRS